MIRYLSTLSAEQALMHRPRACVHALFYVVSGSALLQGEGRAELASRVVGSAPAVNVDPVHVQCGCLMASSQAGPTAIARRCVKCLELAWSHLSVRSNCCLIWLR